VTNNMTPRPKVRGAIVGVDTHKHIHVAVAVDACGRHLGDHAFAADSGGYQALLAWAETHGRIQAFGIEGTGGYGVGLTRAVRRAGHRVVEVNRADRRLRRIAGKSDRIDAEAAARSVLAGHATATPKTADGAVEMIRQLTVARDTAVKARTAAMNTLKQISVNAPSVVREPLHGLTTPRLLARCAALRPGGTARPLPPRSTPCGRWPDAGSPSPRKSPRTTPTSRDSRPRRRPPSGRGSAWAPTSRPSP